jgi:hypothetical protein
MANIFEEFRRNRQLGINQGTSRTVQQTGPVTTEEGLKTNPQWIADSKLIYQNETGKRWTGTDEDVAEWNLNKQSKSWLIHYSDMLSSELNRLKK